MSGLMDLDEGLFLDDSVTITVERMLTLSGLTLPELVDLVEHGAFGYELHQTVVEQWRFRGHSALLARRAVSLRQTFELNTGGTSLVIGLLERMDELQRRVRELEVQMVVEK